MDGEVSPAWMQRERPYGAFLLPATRVSSTSQHTHTRKGLLMVLKSKERGPLTFQGCLEKLTRHANTDRAVDGRRGGFIPVKSATYLAYHIL